MTAVSRPRDGVFQAACSSGDAVGSAVHLVVGVSPRTVSTADPSDIAKMPAVGVVISKSSPTNCVVRWRGESEPVYLGLSTGKPYWVGDDGLPSYSPPTGPPGSVRFAQFLGYSTESTKLLLNVTPTVVGFSR